MKSILQLDDKTVQSITALAHHAAEPTLHSREDGSKMLIFADHTTLDLSSPMPRRKNGRVAVLDVRSFVEYTKHHGGDSTLVCIGWTAACLGVDAILDHHTRDLPGWAQHRCTAKLAATPAWQAWLEHNGEDMTQTAFAEFLEDRLADVRNPSAAELMEVVTTLETNSQGRFKSQVRLQNGDRKFTFEHTSEARAGTTGDLVIPARFELHVQPYHGAPCFKIWARLKYRTGPTGLSLRYELERVDELQTQLLEEMRTNLKAELPEAMVILGGLTNL